MGDTYGSMYTYYMNLTKEEKRELNKKLEEEENKGKNKNEQEKWNEYLEGLNKKYWGKIDRSEIE